MNQDMQPLIRGLVASMMILLPCTFLSAQVTSVRFGNSYVNVSKKRTGGTVEPGDTLEIRTNYWFPNGYNGGNIYFVRYVDNVPTRTVYTDGPGDSLCLITNEGLTYQRSTKTVGDDRGNYKAVPPANEYNIRINIGTGSAAPANNTATSITGAGSLRPGTDIPRVASGTLITTSFKVRVTGNVGDTITLGAGRFLYKKRNRTGDPDTVVNAIQYRILIQQDAPICADAIGRNFVAEAGGTFDSGATQNRSYGPTFTIPLYTYRPSLTPTTEIYDGYYTIVNNLSPRGSIFEDAEKRPGCTAPTTGNPPPAISCANRMFTGHWDIIGDHTGSTTPAGNDPAARGSRGGYMLVVNADYATVEAYRQMITGLCPNTSYEFSLWVRNVCTNCGIDMNGTQTWTPGVLPNLTFAIDGLDRYSSGQVDTVGWIKKGFMFKTSPTQTSITISIRNNASGGGGNDWAIDDIALVTCNPNLTMYPSPTTRACAGNQVDISAVVRSFFDNYTHWAWEKSTDAGATWNPTGITGTGIPASVGGEYQYTAAFPSFLATEAMNNDRYRIKVASTATNLLNADCSFNAITTVEVNVENCAVLPANLLSFTGKAVENHAQLKWLVTDASPNTIFEVERSNDGLSFTYVGTINSRSANEETYHFNDPVPLSGGTYYRIKIKEGAKQTYSKQVLLNGKQIFSMHSLINPFRSRLSFVLISPSNGTIQLQLVDMYGRVVKQSVQTVISGMNNVQVSGLEKLGNGVYSLQVKMGDQTIIRQVVKS